MVSMDSTGSDFLFDFDFAFFSTGCLTMTQSCDDSESEELLLDGEKASSSQVLTRGRLFLLVIGGGEFAGD